MDSSWMTVWLTGRWLASSMCWVNHWSLTSLLFVSRREMVLTKLRPCWHTIFWTVQYIKHRSFAMYLQLELWVLAAFFFSFDYSNFIILVLINGQCFVHFQFLDSTEEFILIWPNIWQGRALYYISKAFTTAASKLEKIGHGILFYSLVFPSNNWSVDQELHALVRFVILVTWNI